MNLSRLFTFLLVLGLLIPGGCESNGSSSRAEEETESRPRPGQGDRGEVGSQDGGSEPDVTEAEEETLPVRTLMIGGREVQVEIAATPRARQRGLMFREELPEMHGMLFIYPDTDFRSFWMRNTKVPLDIAFLKSDGTILQIERMVPETDDSHYSRYKVRYALEMNRGWFQIYDVDEGQKVEGLEEAVEGIPVY